MIKPTFWLICFSLILTACSPDEPALKPLNKDAIVLAFGDSLTYGKGVGQTYSYPAVLGEMTELYVVNDGISGQTSAQGVARLPASLARYQPDLVLLAFGGNDVLQNIPEQQTKNNIEAMIKMAQAEGAQVVLIAMPKKALLAANLALYKQLAEKYQVPVEERIINTLLRDPDYKSDRVHFNAQGYRELAAAIKTLLQDHGAISP